MKDFFDWNKLKTKIELIDESKHYFNEREIWWCSIGINVGNEQDGKNRLYERPVLIIKKFNPKICIILPMSSVGKTGKFYYSLNLEGLVYTVLLSQIRVLSSKRLIRRIKKIDEVDMRNIKKSLFDLIS